MRECIEKLSHKLAEDKIKWVSESRLHLTLKFLGNTENTLIDEIGNTLNNISSKVLPFKLNIKEVKIFKDLSDPKIIWFGIERSSDLKNLQLQTICF